MLRCYVIDPDTGDPTEYTSYLRADKRFEVGSRAYDGQADQAPGCIFDDSDGELDWLVELAAGRVIYFTEDASGAELVIASGRIASKAVERGTFAADKGREFSISIEDRNADLRNIIVHGWERPREPGRTRVLALLDGYLAGAASSELNPNADIWGRDSTDIAATYVPDSMNQWMSAHTYDETDPLAILRECAETEGKRFFVYTETDGSLALYYAPVTETAQLNSTISVSTVIADVNGTTCFEPIWNAGPAFDSNGQETISGALMIHPDGSTTYERRDAPNIPTGALDIEERHDRREQSVHTQGSSTDGVEELHAYLNFRDQEERRRQFSLDIPDDRIHLVKAGMRMEVKLAWAGLIPSSEFFRIGQTRIRWVGPSASEDNHYQVIVTLEYPIKLLRRWGSEDPGPQPAPECQPDDPGAPLITWSFDSDDLDDTATYNAGLVWEPPSANCPIAGSPCAYNTASSGPADQFAVVAGTSYTLALDVRWKYDPSVRDILVRWYDASHNQITFTTAVDGSPYSSNVTYSPATTVTAPVGAAFASITYSSFAGVFVDNVVWGSVGTAAENDPFCLPDPGTSPYYARSDDPRFTADDAHLITRLSGRHINSSAVTLEQGDVVVADLVDENAVTTTTTAGYTAGMVGVVLEGGIVGAEVIVGWQGRFSFVNLDAVATAGDTITTSSSATAGTPVTGRTEGSVGRVLAVDASDAPTIVEWWGVPDSAVGSGSGSYVLNSLGGKEVVHAHGNTGATETIDLANGNWHTVTLDANCTFTFAGATTGTGCSFRLRVHQDATGSRTATWPGSVVWPAATPPTLSTAANAVDLLSFESNDGGTIWYGSYLSGGGGGSYTDEQAQDAVGTILVDTATVDLTYTDATPSITAAVIPGGIKLDDLGTPDDNTDLNASTSRHGLLKKLDNSVTNFMNGQGDWSAPGVSSAGLNGGTSFPGSPGTNDLFFRTDRDLIYYYDGTRWLTAAQYPIPLTSPLTITGTTVSGTEFSRTGVPYKGVYSLWLDSVEYATYISTTNNGSQFWTVTCNRVTDAGAATSLGNFTTAADTASRFTRHTIAIGAVVDSTAVVIDLVATKTSTPGAFFPSDGVLMTRLVG